MCSLMVWWLSADLAAVLAESLSLLATERAVHTIAPRLPTAAHPTHPDPHSTTLSSSPLSPLSTV